MHQGANGLRGILESFQSFNDLRQKGLEILEVSFWEREDQLQLCVQILKASSVLAIQVCCGRSHHAVGVVYLVGAKVERFHRRKVITSTPGGMETLETAKAVEASSVIA